MGSSRFCARLLLLSSLVVSAAPALAQIANPSFEQGDDPGTSLRVSKGSAAITGWTVSGDVVQYGGTAWAAQQGSRSVGLYDALLLGVTSAIQQTFNTTPGTQYALVFWYAPAPLDGPCLNRVLTVRVAGQQASFQTHGVGTAANPGWLQGSMGFTATANTTTLEFANEYETHTCGVLVDNVLVTAPVPVHRTSWGQLRRRFR